MLEQLDHLFPIILPRKQPDLTVQRTLCKELDDMEKLRRFFQQIFTDETSAIGNNDKPILVSIDLSHGNKKKGFSSIGVSMLDTRCLASAATCNPKYYVSCPASKSAVDTEDYTRCLASTPIHDTEDTIHPLIRTQTYVYDSSSHAHETGRGALFNGGAQKLTKGNRLALLKQIFTHFDELNELPCCGAVEFQTFNPATWQKPKSPGSLRPIVVVGHGLCGDLASLRKAGFNIAQCEPILALLDMQRISQEISWAKNQPRFPTLKKLCELVCLHPIRRLHHSGNDAAYTLLILLCLASMILDDGSENTNVPQVLDIITQKYNSRYIL